VNLVLINLGVNIKSPSADTAPFVALRVNRNTQDSPAMVDLWAELEQEMRLTFFSQFTSSFQLHWALGFTQHLTEMSTRILPLDKAQRELKADNLTNICELIV
jgi:hypothetical protein